MKKMLLTFVIGLMTIIGFGQSYKNIRAVSYINQDTNALNVFDKLYKPYSTQTHRDSVEILKYFKSKFNKKYLSIYCISDKCRFPSSNADLIFIDPKSFIDELSGLRLFYDEKKVSIDATNDYILIDLVGKSERTHYEILIKERKIIKTLITL